MKEINRDRLKELLENDKEINDIVNNVDYTQEEGEVKTAPYGYDSGSTIQKKGRFLEFNKEQKEEMVKRVNEFRSDDQRMAILFLKLNEKHPEKWGCGGRFGSFKNPSSCGGCVNGKVNLQAIFGKDIPYLKYKGDRCYDVEPFENYKYHYKYHSFDEETSQGIFYHDLASDIEILALYGKGKGEKILNNINKIKDEVEKIEAERKLDEDVVKLLGKNYKSVKEKMPDAIEFLKEMDPSSLDLQEIDVKNKTLLLLGSRSEYGSSGGIGYFSKVMVWSNGDFQEKEYQWRDRWSASNDKPQYSFGKLEIKKVNREGNKLNLEIEAKPGRKEYRPTTVNFTFEIKSPDKGKQKTLSKEEQIEFENFVKEEIEKIMLEKSKMWENKPQMVATYPDGMRMPAGTPTYVNYYRPDVTNKAVSLKSGLAAFVIKEQIDHRVTDPQFRYELYVTKHGKGTEMKFEDHAYLKREGDASITGLRILKGKVIYNTREGKRELE